jgi:predicted acyl esterase
LGISYYAGSQWRVAARQPKGLACIIPWEGMSDYYRDRCRHGGILSNTFIDFWWNRQVSRPISQSVLNVSISSQILTFHVLLTELLCFLIGHYESVWASWESSP